MDTENAGMSPAERLHLLETLPPSTHLTLERAAWLSGYRSPSTLRAAMRDGRLRVERHSARVVLTTAGDLLSYLHALRASEGYRRGQPRQKPEDAGEGGE
jgi:hypothetical protein